MTWLAFFYPYVSGRLCLTLAHSLWQVALLAMAVWVIERLSRRQSLERSYGLHVTAMCLSLAALPITFAVIQLPSANTAAVDNMAVLREKFPESIVALDSPAIPAPAERRERPDGAREMPALSGVPARAGTAEQDWPAIWLRVAPWFVGMYVSGVTLMLVRLLAGMMRAERLRSLAESIKIKAS